MASNNQSFSTLVQETRNRVVSIREDSLVEIQQAIKDCNCHIHAMNTALKSARTVGEKHHITSSIGLMKGFLTMFKALRVVGGGQVSRRPKPSDRVKWMDLESAFASRIQTGAIINLQHKEPIEFLADALHLFSRRMKNICKKEFAVKVNAVFCGEFVAVKGDKEVFEFKYMNTKNSTIYHNTDLNGWFQENVHSPILTQLEEFQVCN